MAMGVHPPHLAHDPCYIACLSSGGLGFWGCTHCHPPSATLPPTGARARPRKHWCGWLGFWGLRHPAPDLCLGRSTILHVLCQGYDSRGYGTQPPPSVILHVCQGEGVHYHPGSARPVRCKHCCVRYTVPAWAGVCHYITCCVRGVLCHYHPALHPCLGRSRASTIGGVSESSLSLSLPGPPLTPPPPWPPRGKSRGKCRRMAASVPVAARPVPKVYPFNPYF